MISTAKQIEVKENPLLTDRDLADFQTRLDECAAQGKRFPIKWRELKALLQTIHALKKQLSDIEEREAACCPEDVPFDEYIWALKKRMAEARNESEQLRQHAADLEHDLNESVRQCNEEHGND